MVWKAQDSETLQVECCIRTIQLGLESLEGSETLQMKWYAHNLTRLEGSETMQMK